MFDELIEELNEKECSCWKSVTQVGVAFDKVTGFLRTKQSAHKICQTSPVQIDYNRLMQRRRHHQLLWYWSHKKNKKMKRREAFIDTIKMPKEAVTCSGEIGALGETLRKLQSSFWCYWSPQAQLTQYLGAKLTDTSTSETQNQVDKNMKSRYESSSYS